MIKFSIVLIHYQLLNGILRLLQVILFRKLPKKTTISQICIFRNGSLGDSVCSLPAIYNIRQNFPNSKIIILYNAGSNNLASIEHIIDKSLVDGFINYIDMPRKDLVKKLKSEKFDLFIELPQVHQPFKSHLRNMLFVRSLGIKHAFGWKIPATRLFPKIQDKYRAFPNVRDHFLSLLSNYGLNVFSTNEFPLGITEEDMKLIDRLFIENNLLGENCVGLVTGAKRSQNIWPMENFNNVAEHLLAGGYKILLIGGKEDVAIAQKIGCYDRCVDFCGKLSPLQSAEAMKRCKLVVTNDTGPMHLAYAVGTFVLAIFGSRDYKGLWYPPKENSVVFRNDDIHCKACFSETCSDNQCMKGILPEMVVERLEKRLGSVRG